MSGAVLPLPGAAAAAVENPRRRGRYPRGVVGLAGWRWAKQRAQQQAADSPSDVPMPAQGLGEQAVGARLLDQYGDEVVVVKGFGLHRVKYSSGQVLIRYGYVCRAVESEQEFFCRACDLTDSEGYATHLQAVWEQP